MDIYVNGEKVTVTPVRGSKPGASMTMSYEMLAELADLKGHCPDVAWRTPQKAMGLLSPGQAIHLIDGMQFDVAVTGAA